MVSFATPDQVATRLGVTFTEAQAAQAQAFLDDVSALIRAETGMDWLAYEGQLSDDLPDVVVTVTVQAAMRAFTNPTGATQKSVADLSVSYGPGGTGVYLTDEELRLVSRAAARPRVGSIQLESPWEYPPTAVYTPPDDTWSWAGVTPP